VSTVVETTAGRISGRERRGVQLFAGIPYAAPPTGPDRYRPPRPHPGWTGTREATAFGAAAPQRPGMMEALAGGGEGPVWDEDCLFLNVVTPACDQGGRPVLVWIHGGGFAGGAGNVPWYDGTSFALEGDCVVVTLNYRLGALGFLHLGGHLDGFEGSGNLGLLDQLAALEWVQQNIAAFGGDPGNVTVFGESAGAMSVGTLLGLPAARGLFHRAIAQSGAAHHVQTADASGEAVEHLIADLGLADAAGLLTCPPDELLAAQARVSTLLTAQRARQGGLSLPFSPTIDGTVIARPPLEAIAAGEGMEVPLLVGTNLDEWNAWALMLPRDLDETKVRKRLERLTPGVADDVLATYRANRPDAELVDVWNAVLTDFIFRIPAIRLAEAVTAAGQPVHSYRFDWPSAAFDGRLGSCHALEIPFVFHTIGQRGVDLFCGGPPPADLARAMHTRWTAYARDDAPDLGDPDGWPVYDTDRRATLVFHDREPVVEDDPRGDERLLWEGHR
jgi:para-nitrobenzyl esterase